jgi:NADPH:quinone reductase-like Zn-dependent oxidoreductase
MKAIRIHEYGGPEVLRYEDAPRPEPASGEVQVRVRAAAVNPVDWKVRAGHAKRVLHYSMPFIPGWDFSGVIESLGPATTRLNIGDEVYGHPPIPRDGAYAQYVVARESDTSLKPKSVDHIHAAAIPLAALTAWQALFDAAELAAGQSVLIHGAAGGVGSFAVQLAKWKGARVIGTASKRNHDYLQSLGADQTIDYNAVKFEDVVSDVDVVLDTISGETMERSWQLLRKGGILVSILEPPSQQKAAAHAVRQAHVFVHPSADQLEEIARLVEVGELKGLVENVFPLEDARQAHELSETGHVRGKIVLSVP